MSSTRRLMQRGSLVPVAATFTQALWHMRHIWRLFALVSLGMIAAVVLVGALPLFSQVNSTAGIRGALNSGLYEKYSFAQADSLVVSTSAIKQANQRMTEGYQQIAGSFFHAAPDSTIYIKNLTIYRDQQPLAKHVLQLHGYDATRVTGHAKLLQGRMPQASSGGLEVALSQTEAFSLKADLGSKLTIFTNKSGSGQRLPVQLTVVGIFSIPLPFEDFWHGDQFDPSTDSQTGITTDIALVSSDALLSTFDALSQAHQGQPINFSAEYYWYYPLDVMAIRSTNVDQFQDQLKQLAAEMPTKMTNAPYITDVVLTNNALIGLLENGLEQNSTSQVPVIMLTALMLGLILLFIGVMTEILVLRQAEAIVLTSHRGASFGQIFATFVTQSLLIGLLALVVSPGLILLLVRLLLRIFFPASEQSALDALPSNALEVALDLRWYLLGSMLVAVGAMSVSVWHTLRNSTLGSGTKTGAGTQRPLWQRFYVDLVLALLGLLIYGFYNYLLQTGSISPQLQILLAGPSMLTAAILMTLGGIMLYLRCFPLLLRLGTAMAARRRGIVPLLSLVVMARAPRQAMRTALLLVFTIAFSLFALVFTATQTQREYDLVNYRAGADFSGELQTLGNQGPSQLIGAYRQVPGVLSASVGHVAYERFPKARYGIQVVAVDTESFASSVVWSQQDDALDEQGIHDLLARMASQRATFAAAGRAPLPAIVDTATKNLLNLSVGKTFTMRSVNKAGDPVDLVMIDVGEVNHLPGTNDLAPLDLGSGAQGTANILVDYQSFVSDYNQTFHNPDANLKLNYVWLHTRQDAASLTIIRHALKRGPLALSSANDAQAMLAELQHDPLYLSLICALTLGIVLSVLLALLGNLTSSWLYVRNRLRSLSVLRALGTTPGQLATLLGWEQGIVYATAIVLGILAGSFFTAITLSSLVFSQTSLTSTQINPYSTSIFILQAIPALRVVIPPSLLIALGVLIVLCALALIISTVTVTRPSLAQTLRLGEDYVEDAPLFVARTKDQKTETNLAGVRQPTTRRPGLVSLFKPRVASRGRAQVPTGYSGKSRMPIGLVLGITVSVLLVSLVPLFSRVAATAGLRDVLARPENRYISVSSGVPRNSSPERLPLLVEQLTRDLNAEVLKPDENYFAPQPTLTLNQVSLTKPENGPGSDSLPSILLNFYGLPAQQMSAHVTVVQGHLPDESAAPLQIALTPEAASFLHAQVGDIVPALTGSPFPVQLVGLFRPTTVGDQLLPANFLSITDEGKRQGALIALTSTNGFLNAASSFAAAHPDDGYTVGGGLVWFYGVNGEQLNIDQLDGLATRLSAIADNLSTVFTATNPQARLPTFALTQYQEGIEVASIPIVTTSILVIGLILLFLSFMSELLVGREVEAIAILRSRGATHRQIFVSFFRRALLYNGLGLVLGLLLLIPALMLLTSLTLLPVDQRALHIATDQPLMSVLNQSGYALAAVVVTLAAISLALYRASGQDYLAMRRESARASQRPLWQRFYLDVIGAIIALAAYAFTLYLTNTGILDSRLNVQVKSPLVLTSTICLVLACSLFFLRLFPWLLRLGTMLATRNRNVAPMLALAQMARAPRQSIRVALLLLFTTTFVIFVSIFTASQGAHITDVVDYWTGADFSGPSSAPLTAQQQNAYQQLPGVMSATTGYVAPLVNSETAVGLKLIAVDPAAFVRTVIWSEMSTPQQQDWLTQALASQRAELQAATVQADPSPAAREEGNAIPAIVDAQTWDALRLEMGKTFVVRDQGGGMVFVVVGKVEHIPTINDRSQTFGFGGDLTSGLLVDYQSYAAVYNYHLKRQQEVPGGFGGRGDQNVHPLAPNYVWLSTHNDAQTLAQMRATLSSGPLQLTALYDRRATMQTLSTDPLSQNLVGILVLGAIVPLLLTWVGCLVSAWVTLRQRNTLFGVLRALGCSPRELTRVLLWEQAIVYGAAIVLGVLFGLLTAVMALPSLVLTSTIPGIYKTTTSGGFSPTVDLSNTLDLFSLQNTPPAHAVITPSLGVVIALLLLLGVTAVLLMSRSAARLVLSQALRLNQD